MHNTNKLHTLKLDNMCYIATKTGGSNLLEMHTYMFTNEMITVIYINTRRGN